ncbi:MAG: 16S rRNA (cytosine(1402)-N(4))-methyltransferase RsmH [Waddliaceae bacterium]
MSSQHHKPVLLNEVLQLFEGRCIKVFVDGTLGAGGHAEAILKSHPEIEQFIGFDQDETALEIAMQRLSPFQEKCQYIHSNFSDMREKLNACGVDAVDGILMDIGASSMQLDQAERGFSFQKRGPLDMRMDQSQAFTAKDLVNSYSERELGEIFREGEEKKWRACAAAIVEARESQPIETTEDLVKVLRPVTWKKKGLDPLTLAFQAIRIAVNRELHQLESVIPQAISLLRPQGVLSIISFHRLEDRIVKQLFRESSESTQVIEGKQHFILPKEPDVKVLTKKPIIGSEEEIDANPRARSAKLRAVEKLPKKL